MKHMWSEEELKAFIEEQGGGGGGATLNDIVDTQGNKRFVEGNGTPASVTGLTATYCKWSLSGTHLMCVYAGNINTSASFTGDTDFVLFELPDYVMSKIFPIFGDYISFIDIPFITSEGTIVKTVKTELKVKNNGLSIYFYTGNSVSGNCSFRVQIDLLIDSE